MESWLVERGVPQSGVAAFSAQGFDSVESLVKARLGEADLRELCGRFGSPVTRLYMAKDKQQIEGRPNRGFAFVTFNDEVD